MKELLARTIKPTVIKRVIDEFKKPDGIFVTAFSPSWKQKEVSDRAISFSRELDYSNVMWGLRGETDENAIAILLRDSSGVFDPNLILGACVFRLRNYLDHDPAYAMQWIWICPKARRIGILKQHWNLFKLVCKDFSVEAPVSDNFKSFLKKYSPRTIIS